jgi:hypothetical protein
MKYEFLYDRPGDGMFVDYFDSAELATAEAWKVFSEEPFNLTVTKCGTHPAVATRSIRMFGFRKDENENPVRVLGNFNAVEFYNWDTGELLGTIVPVAE